jgi:hypothetical protein
MWSTIHRMMDDGRPAGAVQQVGSVKNPDFSLMVIGACPRVPAGGTGRQDGDGAVHPLPGLVEHRRAGVLDGRAGGGCRAASRVSTWRIS